MATGQQALLSLSLSASPPCLLLHSAENDNESRAAGAPVSQGSGLLQLTLPADSLLVVIFAVCCQPDLAISSVPHHPLLPPIDHPEWLTASFLTPSSSSSLSFSHLFDPSPLFLFVHLFPFSCLYLISPPLPVSNPPSRSAVANWFQVSGGTGKEGGERNGGEDFTPPSPLIKKMITQNTKIKDENRKRRGR